MVAFECQADQWLWVPNYERRFWMLNCEDGGSKRQSEEHDDSKCQTEDVALNAWNWKDEWLWTPKTDERNDFERLKMKKKMVSNAYEGKWWLWMPN